VNDPVQTRSGPLHGGRQESQPNSRRNDRAVIVSLTGARQLALTQRPTCGCRFDDYSLCSAY
jgi:hypothetical protein